MHAALTTLPILGMLLIGTKAAGLFSQRLGMTSVFGELLLGLLLGPSMLNIVTPSETLSLIGQIGVVMLMFLAGIETEFDEMRHVGRASLLTAVGGVTLPLAGGYLLGLAFGLESLHALFLGAVLTATSVSISTEVLREIGRLQSRLGRTILGAAVIDDILGILVLSLVLALAGAGTVWLTIGKIALFLPAAWLLGNMLVPYLLRAERLLLREEISLAMLTGILLLYAWSAEALGSISIITGAYLLGVIVSRHTDLEHHLHKGMKLLGYGFFVPFFFVGVGLEAKAGMLLAAPALTSAVLLFALIGKIVGCGIGAKVGGFSIADSLSIGAGMVARGEVALVMLAVGMHIGLVNDELFAAIIIMTLATTLATPLLLRLTFIIGERIQKRTSSSATTE